MSAPSEEDGSVSGKPPSVAMATPRRLKGIPKKEERKRGGRCREFTESADYSGRMFTVYQKDTPIQQESILVLLFNLMKRKSMKHIPQP